MTTILDLYRQRQWRAWTRTPRPLMTDIPVAKAQLQGRVADSYFDNGRTVRWLAGLETPTWRAVRDARTGHVIHCVSDRPWSALSADLVLGLRLMAWLSVRPAVWYWWDHDWVREVPAGTVPTREHINGGWATPGVLEVHVYRREEAHKVMIHEMIHALDLDVNREAAAAVRTEFEAALGFTLWPHLGEAYTELLAEWLWAIARADTVRAAVRLWRAQDACAESQAAAVWARIRGRRTAEDTNVFAYYVLKWVLMQRLDAVLVAENHGISMWLAWWGDLRPMLDAMADAAMESRMRSVRLGMTCDGS
jgi:hypothetical protein